MRKLLFVFLMVIAGQQLVWAETLTYVDLVSRLADMERLAALPADGDKCAQWSSYDRRSRYDAATGKYVGWDANGDGNGIIRNDWSYGALTRDIFEGKGLFTEIDRLLNVNFSAAPKK